MRNEVCDGKQTERGGSNHRSEPPPGQVRGPLRRRELRQLRLEQSARAIGGRNLAGEVALMHADKLADRGLHFLFSRPAGPAGG